MEIPDTDIIEGVLAGDRQLFSVLVRRYQGPIFNLMYRYSGSTEEAADLTQDVFLKAFDKIRTFRPHRPFFPWLYTLALNRAKDWRKQQGRRPVWKSEGTALKDMSVPAEQNRHLEQNERLKELEQALQNLPATTREPLIMRYRYECSIRDVAAVFRISESAAKMRIKRGLALLQEAMTDGTKG